MASGDPGGQPLQGRDHGAVLDDLPSPDVAPALIRRDEGLGFNGVAGAQPAARAARPSSLDSLVTTALPTPPMRSARLRPQPPVPE